MSPLMTAERVGELLAIEPRSVLAMARRGEIPSMKIGRAVRFSPDDLQRWLDDCRVEGSTTTRDPTPRQRSRAVTPHRPSQDPPRRLEPVDSQGKQEGPRRVNGRPHGHIEDKSMQHRDRTEAGAVNTGTRSAGRLILVGPETERNETL